MKKILIRLIMLLAGLAVGGGAAFGIGLILPAAPASAPAERLPESDPVFVPTGKVLAPLVFPDGRLSGYVSFEVDLETTLEESEFITLRLPLLLHAINMRTYRTPMANGPDGMLPDLGVFRRVVMDASIEAFGKGPVRRAIITQVVPA